MRVERPRAASGDAPGRPPDRHQRGHEVPPRPPALELGRAVVLAQPHLDPAGEREPLAPAPSRPEADRARRPASEPFPLVEAPRHAPDPVRARRTGGDRPAPEGHRARAGRGRKWHSRRVPIGTPPPRRGDHLTSGQGSPRRCRLPAGPPLSNESKDLFGVFSPFEALSFLPSAQPPPGGDIRERIRPLGASPAPPSRGRALPPVRGRRGRGWPSWPGRRRSR
jgi:hypothetical protein